MHDNGKCPGDLWLKSNPFFRAITFLNHNWCSFHSAPPPAPLFAAGISSRCVIGDKHAGQCRPHHQRPGLALHANNCQAVGPPFCFALIDSSPLKRFIGVRTFLSVTSNWRACHYVGGPGPWLAVTGLGRPCQSLWWLIYSTAAVLWQQGIRFVFYLASDRQGRGCCQDKAQSLRCLRGQMSW